MFLSFSVGMNAIRACSLILYRERSGLDGGGVGGSNDLFTRSFITHERQTVGMTYSTADNSWIAHLSFYLG